MACRGNQSHEKCIAVAKQKLQRGQLNLVSMKLNTDPFSNKHKNYRVVNHSMKLNTDPFSNTQY